MGQKDFQLRHPQFAIRGDSFLTESGGSCHGLLIAFSLVNRLQPVPHLLCRLLVLSHPGEGIHWQLGVALSSIKAASCSTFIWIRASAYLHPATISTPSYVGMREMLMKTLLGRNLAILYVITLLIS